MDAKVTYNGIHLDLRMDKEPISMANGSFVHFAKVLGVYEKEDLLTLKGQKLWDQPIIHVMLSIFKETNQEIGLVLQKKMW